PATGTSGFGSASVKGRMRVPRPAASTMAFRVTFVAVMRFPCAPPSLRRWNMRVVPRFQITHRRMNHGKAQIAPYARQMTEVLRFAIALVEPCEDTEDLGRALRAERDIELDEGGRGEVRIGVEPRLHIVADQRDLQLVRHVDARVLQQR